jgi:hypothetical protein
VDWIGSGIWLVHRNVFLDIQKKFPELGPKTANDDWNFFAVDPTQPSNLGEDVAFCRRARAAGHEVWLDEGCRCIHYGYAGF